MAVRRFTQKEIRIVKKMWLAGSRGIDIARQTGRSVTGIFNVARRLELPYRYAHGPRKDKWPSGGRDPVCLDCGYGRLEYTTNGMGYVSEQCPKCGWTERFNQTPTVAPQPTNSTN